MPTGRPSLQAIKNSASPRWKKAPHWLLRNSDRWLADCTLFGTAAEVREGVIREIIRPVMPDGLFDDQDDPLFDFFRAGARVGNADRDPVKFKVRENLFFDLPGNKQPP